MIEIKGFKCEYCGILHETKELASRCEESHLKIVDTEAVYRKSDTHPREIIITLSNGRKSIYEYAADLFR